MTKTASNAYTEHKDAVHNMLARLQVSLNSQEWLPETPNWGHAGTMENIRSQIQEIADQVEHKGEYT